MNDQNIGVGGGEVLEYIGQGNNANTTLLDENVIRQFMLLPIVKVLIVVLLIVLAIIIVAKILELRSPFKGKAINSELDYLDMVKKHDESIVKANRTIRAITNIIEKSPFMLSKSYVDYWAYNLERANIKIPGKARFMKPQEFNAIIKIAEIATVGLGLFIAAFLSAPAGLMLIISAIFIASTMPMATVRSIVKVKDNEIIENFADFYLMIHYVLLASAGTPISGIMKSYDKTTSSEEMHRFVDVCIHYIDTYGEYEATRYISKQYREIAQVGKLMRLIRQANEGGDVRAELIGFRDELLSAKKYAIRKRMEKLVIKAKASFNILMPILIQAIISAMAIYLEDLKLTSTFLG